MSVRPLHIALTADPGIAVPPQLYGGIERIVDMVVRGLVTRGHTVTLFARAGSSVPCRLVPYPTTSSTSRTASTLNTLLVSSRVWREKFDVVHSFGRLAYVLPVLPTPVPKIMSYQRAVTEQTVIWGSRLSRGTLHFTACSRSLLRRLVNRDNWHVIYNGVPSTTFEYRGTVTDDAPLVFLGRMEHIKGPHLAIEVAKRTGRRLVLAGNIPNAEIHQTFFKTRIAPHIDDGQIEYVGPVTDSQKNALLGRAAALLMPVLWEEPFGIVMAEALACGTPVIGLNRGSVAEVVDHEVNGFVCNSLAEMIEAVQRLGAIDRANCRRVMEEKFSDTAVVDAYEQLYYRLLRKPSRSSVDKLH